MSLINLNKATSNEIKSLNPEYLSGYSLSGIKLAVKKGYNVYKKDSYGYDIMYYTAKKGFLNHVKYLEEQGMNCNKRYKGKKLMDTLSYQYEHPYSDLHKERLKKVIHHIGEKKKM